MRQKRKKPVGIRFHLQRLPVRLINGRRFAAVVTVVVVVVVVVVVTGMAQWMQAAGLFRARVLVCQQKPARHRCRLIFSNSILFRLDCFSIFS